MGIFNIEIRKIEENQKEAVYSFREHDLPKTGFGKISVNKKNGDIKIIEEAEWDKSHEDELAIRAGTKILQHWRKGELPDITGWVS